MVQQTLGGFDCCKNVLKTKKSLISSDPLATFGEFSRMQKGSDLHLKAGYFGGEGYGNGDKTGLQKKIVKIVLLWQAVKQKRLGSLTFLLLG